MTETHTKINLVFNGNKIAFVSVRLVPPVAGRFAARTNLITATDSTDVALSFYGIAVLNPCRSRVCWAHGKPIISSLLSLSVAVDVRIIITYSVDYRLPYGGSGRYVQMIML